MDFNEQTAHEIVQKFGLDEKTIKVWKTRNKIPDKYADPEYSKPVDVTNEKNIHERDRIIKILNSEKFNIQSIARLSGIKGQKMSDVLSGRSSFTVPDILALKKAINGIRINVAKTLSLIEKSRYENFPETDIKKLFNKSELQFFVIIDRDKDLHNKLTAWNNERRVFPAELVDKIKHGLFVFLIETAI